jgi:hypothetical protein
MIENDLILWIVQTLKRVGEFSLKKGTTPALRVHLRVRHSAAHEFSAANAREEQMRGNQGFPP